MTPDSRNEPASPLKGVLRMVRHSMLVPARRHLFPAAILVAACACAAPVFAQSNDTMTPIATPDQPNAIEVGTGPLPDAKTQESWHSQYGSKFARNVTVATLTPFLPDPAKASGAAVVVAPGGGFRTLSKIGRASCRERG